VDNCPYRIDCVGPVKGGGSRLSGRLIDFAGGRVVQQDWTLTFTRLRGKVRVKKEQRQAPDLRALSPVERRPVPGRALTGQGGVGSVEERRGGRSRNRPDP